MKHGALLFLLTFLIAYLVIMGVPIDTAASATHSRKVCSTTHPALTARCHAVVLAEDNSVTPLTSSGPRGYSPADFRAAYGAHGSSATRLGIVVAYDAPNIQSDLMVYSKTFGLPLLPSCSSASQTACFSKLSQHGTRNYPATNSSWAVEASLDVESVHGMCPGCRISLVEANSASMDDLSAAVDQAIAQGARIVSNSYGGEESSGEAIYDRHYHRPGITMVASSGDSGYGTTYPAASPFVLAVGGTSLIMNGMRVSSETAWSGSGSGCSLFEYKPYWQHDKKCVMRSIADIAADADPATGAAIYDSYPSNGHSGWFKVGGTSLAAPLVAGLLASSGHAGNQPDYLYGKTSAIRDIVSGHNGSCASYLCKSAPGYDGPTGLGVLSGL